MPPTFKMTVPCKAVASGIQVHLHDGKSLTDCLTRLEQFDAPQTAGCQPNKVAWLPVLERGLRHAPYCLEATDGTGTVGLLPLVYVASPLFGKMLVSLSYLNTGGVIADSPWAAGALIDNAVSLADELGVKYLELRHELKIEHPALTHERTSKVHMRLALPVEVDMLWKGLNPKVRNQVRKGGRFQFAVEWGRHELLDGFYSVFSQNMRDLGTPVFSPQLFQAILDEFTDTAEICCVRDGRTPVAAALLVHGRCVTEVPSASSLREYRESNANMLMYWNLLERAIARGQRVFDFGRSTQGDNNFRFKKQWGAEAEPAVWQYYVRHGDPGDMRPESKRYRALIGLWQHLPLPVTRWLGPAIVRGIP